MHDSMVSRAGWVMITLVVEFHFVLLVVVEENGLRERRSIWSLRVKAECTSGEVAFRVQGRRGFMGGLGGASGFAIHHGGSGDESGTRFYFYPDNKNKKINL